MINLLLADDCSVVDSVICPPPTVQPADLGDLLAVVADRMQPNGVLMLSGRWGAYVRDHIERHGSQKDDPAPTAAGDWTARIMQGDVWVRWTHGDDHTIWTCDVDSLAPAGKDSPLIDANPIITASNFHQWLQITGVPWVGTPGMAGNALLVDGYKTMNPKAKTPFWSQSGIWYPTEERAWWPLGHIERPYTPAQWSRDCDGDTHGYDLNKAYLSAYLVAELPIDSLSHHDVSPGYDFNPADGSIWRVELSPWRYEHLLPDPAGYAATLPDGTRWLTTPTLVLLQQLTDRGDYDGFTVREFWGGSPTRRVTRKWSELINDIAGAAREPIATAAKQVYKQTYGMWARAGRVARTDWHYMIIAQNRVNLWRKMDAAYRGHMPTLQAAEPAGSGPYPEHIATPVRVETDAVFYAAEGYAWDQLATMLRLKTDPSGIKLGHFKPYVPKGER